MRFKLDENLPPGAANILQEAKHDTVTVLEQNMGGWPDDRLITAVNQERRILITLDLDFSDIRTYPPGQHPGIIILRPKNQDLNSISAAIHALIPFLGQEDPSGSLWILDGQRLRIRE